MVHRDVEETLDLLCMQVHGENTMSTGSNDEVGDKFGGDGDTWLILSILARISVEWQDSRDSFGAGPSQGINHDEHLHQMLIRWWRSGLDNEDVLPTHVFLDLYECLSIGKRTHLTLTQGNIEISCNVVCKWLIRIAAENFHNC